MKNIIFLIITLISFNCFSQNIIREAIKNSNLQEIAYQLQLEPSSKQTIETKFTIEKDGTISNIKAFSTYSELNKEAINILQKIEKLKPLKASNGEYVEQYISLPIVFTVESMESRKYRLRKEARRKVY